METSNSIKAKVKELAIIAKIASQALLGKDKIVINPPAQNPES
jgi:hypothetical protein